MTASLKIKHIGKHYDSSSFKDKMKKKNNQILNLHVDPFYRIGLAKATIRKKT